MANQTARHWFEKLNTVELVSFPVSTLTFSSRGLALATPQESLLVAYKATCHNFRVRNFLLGLSADKGVVLGEALFGDLRDTNGRGQVQERLQSPPLRCPHACPHVNAPQTGPMLVYLCVVESTKVCPTPY